MKKCVMCGHRGLQRRTEQLDFGNVAVVEGVVYTCPKCDERYEAFKKVEELSRTVAHHIARRVERLNQAEIRFLRKYLGYSSKSFAQFLDMTPETISRWESTTSPKQMRLSTEKLLRYMALNERPVSDYGLDKAGSSSKASTLPRFRERKGMWVAA